MRPNVFSHIVSKSAHLNPGLPAIRVCLASLQDGETRRRRRLDLGAGWVHALSYRLAFLVVRLATAEEQRVCVLRSHEQVESLDGVEALLSLTFVCLPIPRACAEEGDKTQTTSSIGIASVERIHASAVWKQANIDIR